MILANYWSWLNTIIMNNISSNYDYAPCVMTTLAGEKTTHYSVDYRDQPVNLYYRLYPVFGKGSTPSDPTVHCLADDVTSSISNVSFSIQSDPGENLTRTITVSGRNASSTAFTLTEIGIVRTMLVYTEQASGAEVPVMLAFIKLEKPISLQPGEDFTALIEWIEQ